MANNHIMGSQELVIDYNLNNQFSNVSKLIISSQEFLNGVAGNTPLYEDLKSFFELSKEQRIHQKNQLNQIIEQLETSNDFYKNVQEHIKTLGKEIDVALKNYNFMSSVSNTRYTITLRDNYGSYSKYFVEKNSLIGSMKQLFIEYLLKIEDTQKWDTFQIECYSSEDIYKKLYVKKEDTQLLLYGVYGCDPQLQFNALGGGELYHSINENFFFYENKQEYAYLRQHGSLEKKEINKQQRVLASSELKSINEATKQIDNVILEAYLTPKGEVRILHVTSNQHPLGVASQNGCVIYKSTKNYNKISLVPFKECGELETTNPLYLLIKNEIEMQSMITSIQNLAIDGIIFTYNFYHPYLEYIAENKDIDIIYYNEPLQRAMEVTINWDNFTIQGATSKTTNNPFSSIISSEEKGKDELLEKLKNVDLSTTQNSEQSKQYEEIEQLTQSMTSSPNSSQSKMANSNTFSNVSSPNAQNKEKKSAIGMLADVALNQGPKQESGHEQSENQNTQKQEEYIDYTSQNQTQQKAQQETQDVFASTQPKQESQSNSSMSNEIEQYFSTLATKLYTPAQIPSQGHIIDPSSLSEISDQSDIVLVVSTQEEITNPSLNYALPISSGIHSQAYTLISSPQDYFLLISTNQNAHPLVNISVIEEDIKDSFIQEISKNYDKLSLIISKQDIPLLYEFIPNIDIVYIKDIEEEQELEMCKNKIMSFEKQILLSQIK